MKKSTLRTSVTAVLIVAATSTAFALNTFVDTTRQGPTVTPRFQIAYKYKVGGSKSKGAEKFHTSVGQAFLGDQGASFQGDFEVRNDVRPTFDFTLFAPVGAGGTTDSSMKINFNSKKLDPQDAAFEMGEFAFALQRLDDDIGGHFNSVPPKRAPVSVNGIIEITQLKVKGKLREKRGEWSGSVKYIAKGTVTSGENAGKTIKATIKAKLKRAPLDD